MDEEAERGWWDKPLVKEFIRGIRSCPIPRQPQKIIDSPFKSLLYLHCFAAQSFAWHGNDPYSACPMLDDLELIHGLQNGCADCLAPLFLRYCSLVRSVSWKILREPSETDDIVQEVFIVIFQRAAEYDRARGSVTSWIAQLAYWKAHTRRRQLAVMKLRQVEADDSGVPEPQAPYQSLCHPERIAMVSQSLGLLNDRQRRIIELIHFEGYTLSECALLSGESLANARNLYYRGMKFLRNQLAPQSAETRTGYREELDATKSTSP